MINNTTHTLITEPAHFAKNVDRWRTLHANRKLGRQHLDRLREADPSLPVSKDYADGYVSGFADYLTYGGDGSPPVVPPRRYWRLGYKSPNGYDVIQDWFTGFRDGALQAEMTGLREWATVPSSSWLSATDEGIPPGGAVTEEILEAPIPSPLDGFEPFEPFDPAVPLGPQGEGEGATLPSPPLEPPTDGAADATRRGEPTRALDPTATVPANDGVVPVAVEEKPSTEFVGSSLTLRASTGERVEAAQGEPAPAPPPSLIRLTEPVPLAPPPARPEDPQPSLQSSPVPTERDPPGGLIEQASETMADDPSTGPARAAKRQVDATPEN